MKPYDAIQLLKNRDAMFHKADSLKENLLKSAQRVERLKNMKLTVECLHALGIWLDILSTQIKHVDECLNDAENCIARCR